MGRLPAHQSRFLILLRLNSGPQTLFHLLLNRSAGYSCLGRLRLRKVDVRAGVRQSPALLKPETPSEDQTLVKATLHPFHLLFILKIYRTQIFIQ